MCSRYQDYVIKDGVFIGKFEEMYQKFDDPWEQKKNVDDLYVHYATSMTIRDINSKHVLEVGCGLGALTNYLSNLNPDVHIVGMDISESAIRKAQEAFPDRTFFVGNINDISAEPNDRVGGGRTYDTLMFTEIMWYILDDLENIICNLQKNYRNCYFIVNQCFYHGTQSYGNEFFTNLKEMVAYFPFKLLKTIEVNDIINDRIETHSVFRI